MSLPIGIHKFLKTGSHKNVYKNKSQQIYDLAKRERELTTALNQIRDLLPVPPHYGILRDLYINTLGHPEAIPAYVQAHLRTGAEAEKIRRDAGLRRRHDDPPPHFDPIIAVNEET